jgi:hypothetical protein
MLTSAENFRHLPKDSRKFDFVPIFGYAKYQPYFLLSRLYIQKFRPGSLLLGESFVFGTDLKHYNRKDNTCVQNLHYKKKFYKTHAPPARQGMWALYGTQYATDLPHTTPGCKLQLSLTAYTRGSGESFVDSNKSVKKYKTTRL